MFIFTTTKTGYTDSFISTTKHIWNKDDTITAKITHDTPSFDIGILEDERHAMLGSWF